jgi:hypothetical protein
MTQAMLTNVLIGLLITLISFLGKRLVDKLDDFEKAVQNILISDVEVKKDIEVIKEDIVDHEVRITKLEK